MIRCASGSIQVVTKVARLRSGIPSRTISSPISRIATTGSTPSAGISSRGAPSISQFRPSIRASDARERGMVRSVPLILASSVACRRQS